MNMNTENYSFYAVPVAWLLALAPHAYAMMLLDKKFDNMQPRSNVLKLESDQSLDKATKGFIVRAEGAQQNGFENLGLFAAAVVAGNIAGLPARTLNILSGGYLASRVLYNIVYINNTTPLIGHARSTMWLTSVGFIFGFFIMSGNALKSRVIV